MLIIKKDIDINEFIKKYDFEPRYNELTGEMETLLYDGIGNLFFKKTKNKTFRNLFKDEYVWAVDDNIFHYSDYTVNINFDLVYKLVKDGVLESDGCE